MNTNDTQERLAGLLAEPISQLGLDLEAVEVSMAGKQRLLRIAVDKDGGIDMDDVADATREISQILDAQDVMGDAPYTLEVSSPGVSRPLTLPRHWRRNNGRLVNVTLRDGTVVTGRIFRSDEESATLRVNTKGKITEPEIAFADVKKAKVEIEFKAFEGFDDEGPEED